MKKKVLISVIVVALILGVWQIYGSKSSIGVGNVSEVQSVQDITKTSQLQSGSGEIASNSGNNLTIRVNVRKTK